MSKFICLPDKTFFHKKKAAEVFSITIYGFFDAADQCKSNLTFSTQRFFFQKNIVILYNKVKHISFKGVV